MLKAVEKNAFSKPTQVIFEQNGSKYCFCVIGAIPQDVRVQISENNIQACFFLFQPSCNQSLLFQLRKKGLVPLRPMCTFEAARRKLSKEVMLAKRQRNSVT